MDNLQNFDSFNEGLKDILKNRWNKFKDEMHPWDFTSAEWNAKWGKKPQSRKVVDPFNEEEWPEEQQNEIPQNPYSVTEFNELIRNREIERCEPNRADFIWNYKSGKSVHFRKKH